MTRFSLGFSLESAMELVYSSGGHGMFFGSTGSSKTSSLLIPNGLLQTDASKFFIDSKNNEITSILGEYLARLGPYYAYSPYGMAGDVPWGVKAFARYNPMLPLFDGRTPALRREAIARRNSDACVGCEAVGRDAFFVNDARRVFTVMQIALAKFGERDERNLAEVARVIEAEFPEFCERITKQKDDSSPIFRGYLREIETGSHGFSDVLETIKAETQFLRDPAIAESLSGSDFRFIWLTERMMTIAICLPMDLVEVNGKLCRLMVSCCLGELLQTGGAR
jgi:type IV secretory pathway TraG/TraD family ATPase VirD4